MKPFPFIAAFCTAGILLAGCGGGSEAISAPVADALVTTRSQYGPLALTLTVPKSVYKKNEVAPITLTVTNTSADSVEASYTLASHQSYVQQGDKLIWGSIAGGGGIGALTADKFAPGETKTFPRDWQLQDNNGKNVTTGRYQVYARYATVEVHEGTKEALFPVGTQYGLQLEPPPIEITVQ